jgi:hypothetical protein
MKAISRARYAESIPLYERALALVPDSANAKAELADMLIQRVGSVMSPSLFNDRTWGMHMKTKTIAQLLVLSGVAACVCATPSFAAGGVHCQDVGGGILTNFLDPSQCLPTSGSAVALCTDGALRQAICGVRLGFKCSRSTVMYFTCSIIR